MTILPILLLFALIGTLFYGGYKQRRDRVPASTDTEVVIVGDSAIMMTKQEIADFIMREKMRRTIVKNKSAYKAMKPKKWRIGSWSK
jgi:hypothetical protein